ncbi:MAG: winged helix-turn-helix transcriptional regulator [Thermoleophilia bacterium]
MSPAHTSAACDARDVFAAISNKWIGLILVTLGDGPMRYSGIHASVEGISQKMLTQSLRELERHGLVTRTVTPTVPVRVDYEITPLGASLEPVMSAMKTWAESHVDEVRAAQAAFADRPAPAAVPR